jgi:hypothetical protein
VEETNFEFMYKCAIANKVVLTTRIIMILVLVHHLHVRVVYFISVCQLLVVSNFGFMLLSEHDYVSFSTLFLNLMMLVHHLFIRKVKWEKP